MDLKQLLREKIWTPALALLQQGLTPHKLTLSVVMGALGGVIPVPGVSTLLLGAIALVMRLNQPAIQLANYSVYALQLLLILPFIRAGEYLFNAPTLPLSVTKLLEMLKEDLTGTVVKFADTLLYAVAAWALCSLLAAPILYFILKPILTRLMARFAKKPA